MSRGEKGKEVEFNKRKENGLKQRWITSTWQGSRPKRIRLGGYIYLKGARAETDEKQIRQEQCSNERWRLKP